MCLIVNSNIIKPPTINSMQSIGHSKPSAIGKDRKTAAVKTMTTLKNVQACHMLKYYLKLFEALAGTLQSEVYSVSLTRHSRLRSQLNCLIKKYIVAINEYIRENPRAILDGRMQLAVESTESQRNKDTTRSRRLALSMRDDYATDCFPFKSKEFNVGESCSYSTIDRPLIRLDIDNVSEIVDDIEKITGKKKSAT